MNIISTNKLVMLCTAVCAAAFAFSPNANALTIDDNQTLGHIFYGIPSGDQDRTDYTNHLIDMYNNGITDDPSFLGQSYHIVHGAPAFGTSMPAAVFASNGTSTNINLGSGLYSYLFAKYDGQNQGSIVWYVGNLSGNITIPSNWNQYGLSGWTLFSPGSGTPGVPESGATVMLFGAALVALALARRALKV